MLFGNDTRSISCAAPSRYTRYLFDGFRSVPPVMRSQISLPSWSCMVRMWQRRSTSFLSETTTPSISVKCPRFIDRYRLASLTAESSAIVPVRRDSILSPAITLQMPPKPTIAALRRRCFQKVSRITCGYL